MPEQGLPLNPIAKALTAIFLGTPAIADLLTDDGDKIYDQLVPPTEGDTPTLRPMPYLAWGTVADSPHADFSSAFGQAGSASSLQLHIFEPHRFTKSFTLEIANQIKRRISGKKHTLEGFVTLTCLVTVTACVSVPTGMQGILSIDFTTRTIPTP